MPLTNKLILPTLFWICCSIPAYAQNAQEIEAEKSKLLADCIKETAKILQDTKIKYRDENKLTAKVCNCAMEDNSLSPFLNELIEVNILKALPRPPSDVGERSKKASDEFLKASEPIIARCIKTNSVAHMPRDSDEES